MNDPFVPPVFDALDLEVIAIIRAVIRDNLDMTTLAEQLGCTLHEAGDRYLAAKLAMRLSIGTNRLSDPPTGEQLLAALRKFPNAARWVAVECILFGRTVAEAVVELGWDRKVVWANLGIADGLLENRFPRING